jgi:restriction endonuclease S subunit
MKEIETKLDRLDDLEAEKQRIFQFLYTRLKPLLAHLEVEDFDEIRNGFNGQFIITYSVLECGEGGDEYWGKRGKVIDTTYFDNPKEYIEKYLTKTAQTVY